MKKITWFFLLVVLLAPQSAVLAKESHWIFQRAEGFTVPDGGIAYLGCTYSPRKIWKKDSVNTILRSAFGEQTPPASQAVSELEAALFKRAVLLKIPLEKAPATNEDQRAVFGHLFNPKKNKNDAKVLRRLCGGKPYALIGIIDFYSTFACEVQIREKAQGNKLDYWQKRSILELENESQHYHKVGAWEFFLVSAKDGSLLWQANGVEHIEHIIFNSFKDTAAKGMEHMLKDLAGSVK